MQFTKLLYWFFKNLLALTLPLVIIVWSLGMTIPDVSSHQKTLNNTNFYSNLSGEIQNLSTQNYFNPKEGLWYLIISSTQPDTASVSSLKNLFEKNITLTSSWINGDSQTWYFYLPVSQISNSLDKNFDIKTVQVAESKKVEIPACPDQSTVKYIINLELDFCIPENIQKGNGLMSDFVRSNLNFQNKTVQVLFGKNPEILKQSQFKATEAGVVSEGIMVSLNNFRDGFLKTKNIANILLPILLISLVLVPLFALALNKRPINELKIILRLLGISLLVNTLVLMVTSQVIFLQNFSISGFNSEALINIFSNVVWAILVDLMSPALIFSLVFITLSVMLYFVERADLDTFRHLFGRNLETFLEASKLKKVMKK